MELVKAINKIDWSDVWNTWAPTTSNIASIWNLNRKRMSYVYFKLLQLHFPENFPREYLHLRGPAFIRANTSIEGWAIYYVGFHGWMDIFIYADPETGPTTYNALTDAISVDYLHMLALDHFDVVNIISSGFGGTLPLKWKKEDINMFYGTRYRLILFNTFEIEASKPEVIGDGFNIITGTAPQAEGTARVPHMVNIVFHPNSASFWSTLNMPLQLETYTGNDIRTFEENFVRFLWL